MVTSSAEKCSAPVLSAGIEIWHDPADADVGIVVVHRLTVDPEHMWIHRSASG